MYWIVTDSTTDLPKAYVEAQEKLQIMRMSFTMDGASYYPDGTDENSRKIYKALRDGSMITTAQINSETWKECFQPLLDKGEDVLAIIFSSGLSGTYLSAEAAAQELRGLYPGRTLEVVDSLSASAGEGMLVHYALQNRAKGMSLTDNANWVRANRQNTVHWFTVDDLHFLRRGGRVSAASAYFGSIVKIKPILNVDFEGHLIPREKVQGRKHSLRRLCDKVKENIVNPAEQVVFISHGDCEDEARTLADMIRRDVGVKDVQISFIGPIVGSHSGPGTLAVFFMSRGR